MVSLSEHLTDHVTILPALPEHAADINRIALSLKLSDRPSPDAGKNGFILFVPGEEEYRRRIIHSKHIFVADNGAICGFITGFDKNERVTLGREADPAVQAARTALGALDFIFIDQLAVAPKLGKTGIGQSLLNHLCRASKRVKLFAGAIVESPLRNEASLDFCVRKNGFARIAEVTDGAIARGIYLLDKR